MRSGVSAAVTGVIVALLAGPAAADPGVAVAAWAGPQPGHHPLTHLILGIVALLTLLNLAQGVMMLSARRTMRRALALAEDRAAAVDRAHEEAKRERRPLIAMKSLALAPFSPGSERYAVNDESYLKSVSGRLWNQGTALGSVTSVRMECKLASAIPPALPADEAGTVLNGRRPIGIGEIWAPETPLQAAWLNASFDKHVLTLFVWGWVRYEDNFGIARRSGFAYEFVPAAEGQTAGEFRPCGPSSYWFDAEE